MRKGQVSVFIIIGIVLVIIVASYMIIRATGSKEAIKDETTELSDSSFVSMQSYFDDCTKTMVT
jgi:flagellar basal body-associated protein FliL